jgi:glycosyltransferase involved in cell wall biosynthesis
MAEIVNWRSSETPFEFTCLLPIYRRDKGEIFQKSLLSVYENTRLPVEVIVCEDGELPPDLEACLESLSQRYDFTRIKNTGAPGLHNNLNNALKHVKTPWICRADADDINVKFRFATQIEFLEAHPDVSVLGSEIRENFVDGSSRVKRMPLDHDTILRSSAYRNPINHMTVFVKTDSIIDCGGYPPISYKEDYALWLTMLAKGHKLHNIAEALVEVTVNPDFYKRRGGGKNIHSELELLKLKNRLKIFPRRTTALSFVTRTTALCASPYVLRAIYRSMRG